MSQLHNLITDRTRADVVRAQTLAAKGLDNMTEAERAEWVAGMKGAYNVADLARVDAAVNYLAQIALVYIRYIEAYLAAAGVDTDPLLVPPYEAEDVVVQFPQQAWTEGQIPAAADLEAYLRNIHTLRALFPLPGDVPRLPDSITGLTYSGANAIEAVLAAVEATCEADEATRKNRIDATAAARLYSGDIYAGEA